MISLFNDDNYEEVVLADSSQAITLDEAKHRFGLFPIVKRFGTWAVTTYGVECLSTSYEIEMHRVDEPDWLSHMRGKTWINMPDFVEALSYARELKKIRQSFSALDKPLKVFLCHAEEDKPTVRKLYYLLLVCGIKPWLNDENNENLLPGQVWGYEIPKVVHASDVVIVCLSHASVSKTGFVQREIKCALDAADERPEGSIFLIPARLEECLIPERLSKIQSVDLFRENGFERLIRSLQACIK